MPATDLMKLKRNHTITWSGLSFFSMVIAGLMFWGFSISWAVILIFALTLAYALQLGSRIRRSNKEAATPAKQTPKLKPYWQVVLGNLLFAGGVGWMSSSNVMLANLSVTLVMLVLLPMTVIAGNKSHELSWQNWTRFLIYVVAISVGWMIDHQASAVEQNNYKAVIAAIERYKTTENRYPHALEQLVPSYLAMVPTGRWGKFMYYINGTDDAAVMHMPMPFVHESYDFKSKINRTWD